MKIDQAFSIVVVVVLATPPMAAASAPKSDYAVTSLNYDIAGSKKIGSLKIGLICFPNGRLHWAQIAKPREHRALAELSTQLSAGGLSVARQASALYGEAVEPTTFRVAVSVEKVALNLCVPGLGVGERTTAGRGSLTVRWDTYDLAARKLVDAISFEVPFDWDGEDARLSDRPLMAALMVSAGSYAASRFPPKTAPASPSH